VNDKEGYHTLRIYMMDPIIVLQKIVINTGGLHPSFLFPPESFRGKQESQRRKYSDNKKIEMLN
jgi:hypothetical protein